MGDGSAYGGLQNGLGQGYGDLYAMQVSLFLEVELMAAFCLSCSQAAADKHWYLDGLLTCTHLRGQGMKLPGIELLTS